MITVKTKRENNNFTVILHGHAQQGEVGQDLVCCAMSTLMYTLAQNLLNHREWFIDKPTIKLDSGDAYISFLPNPKNVKTANVLFETILSGFKLVSANYPEAVQIVD
jgi:uncharacterized protein YsxB (DUF464 family)